MRLKSLCLNSHWLSFFSLSYKIKLHEFAQRGLYNHAHRGLYNHAAGERTSRLASGPRIPNPFGFIVWTIHCVFQSVISRRRNLNKIQAWQMHKGLWMIDESSELTTNYPVSHLDLQRLNSHTTPHKVSIQNSLTNWPQIYPG